MIYCQYQISKAFNKATGKDLDDNDQDGCEETFAEHGSYNTNHNKGVEDETWSRTLSQKFETEPEKYLEEKLLSALMEQLLVSFWNPVLILCSFEGWCSRRDAASRARAQRPTCN